MDDIFSVFNTILFTFIQSLGLVRIPLYAWSHQRWARPEQGFCTFLNNNLIANSREQLIRAIIHARLLSRDDLTRMIEKSGHVELLTVVEEFYT